MSYYESVKNDVMQALIEITMDDKDLLEEINYNVLCETLDSYDITGDMCGSHFCNSEEAKKALKDSEDTWEMIWSAVYNEYLTYTQLGRMICNAEWETLDVILRMYVYNAYVSDWIMEYIEN